ncbi:MAG: flavin reductase family protein [Chloroflexi bacterium]|nr:flavin reductase family protein [Chloroflexota bacterium]
MVESDPTKALDQLGTPVAMISVAAGERRNVMSATRVTCVSSKPPLMAVSIAASRHTYDLIKEAGEFVVNIASVGQAELANKVGKVSGRDGDKFGNYGIETRAASKVKSPLIAGSATCMECKLIGSSVNGDRTLLIGEVVAMHVDEEARPLQRYQEVFYELGRAL